jgi:hypothetical protein
MTIRYEIKGSVSDGEYFTNEMDAGFKSCELSSIRFFDAGGAQVTPSAGAVAFTGTADGVNYRDIQGGSFNAADAYQAGRTPPYAEGLMVKAKLTLTGVTGADTFSAIAWRA